MIKVILFTIIGIFALIVQWLCMTDVNGVRSIKDYRPFSFLFNPFESLTQTTEPAKLVVAVISRLEQFDRRSAIRNTWKKLTKNSDSTSFFFVMPELPCPIDPEWRIKDSECEPWQVQVLPNLVNNQAPNKPFRIIPTGKKVGSTRPGFPRDGMGFQLKFPIELTQLGLNKAVLNTFYNQCTSENHHQNWKKSSNITVELIDANTHDVISAMNFTRHDLENMPSDDGFMYKNIDSENLLKGFEGLLRIRPHPDNSQCWNSEKLTCNIDWNRVFGEDGPIVWRTSYIGSMAKPSFQNFCPLMTFIYNIPDLLELKQLCVAADTQNKCQENKNKNLMSKLVEEMEDNEDDVYLAPELFDSNSGSSKAFLSFLSWLTSSQSLYSNFDFVLVTDDQSFIAIDSIANRLHRSVATGGANADYNCKQSGLLSGNYCSDRGEPIKLWRSHFQYQKPVHRHGSEAVQNYFAPIFPPVPSAAGSIISREIANYLTHNNNHFLHGFANIAHALAIWLAPIAPSYYDEMDWFNNFNEAANASKFSGIGNIQDRHKMFQLYQSYISCGQLVCY